MFHKELNKLNLKHFYSHFSFKLSFKQSGKLNMSVSDYSFICYSFWCRKVKGWRFGDLLWTHVDLWRQKYKQQLWLHVKSEFRWFSASNHHWTVWKWNPRLEAASLFSTVKASQKNICCHKSTLKIHLKKRLYRLRAAGIFWTLSTQNWSIMGTERCISCNQTQTSIKQKAESRSNRIQDRQKTEPEPFRPPHTIITLRSEPLAAASGLDLWPPRPLETPAFI